MDFIPANFHFLRPLWLLASIPAILLFLAIRRFRAHSSLWDKAIDSSLLPHLLDSQPGGRRRRWPLFILLIAWLLVSFSLAGPVWEKLPQSVQKKEDALVVIQDLSLSFLAQDLSPNRLTRARHKLLDILQHRKEGTTALIVYAGDAHLVTPLTDDTYTIASMVPDLSPAIMPSYGSNLQAAVVMALRLFTDGGVSSGKILLLTDEVASDDVAKVTKLLRGKSIVLSVLGVGSEDGAPIPTGGGGFLKDEQGNIVVPRLTRSVLKDLAEKNGGRYSDLQLEDNDIDYLLAAKFLVAPEDQYRQIDREFDQWSEQGHWLVLLILPFALLAFRRGWIIGLVMIILLSSSNEAQAMDWQDLWLRKDQQAAKALADNEPQKAADLFKEPQWQGVAEYRAGNYGGAAAAFKDLAGRDDNYNRGNALARTGELADALKAYDTALELDHEMKDAKFNKVLVEKLIQQQEQQQQGEEQKQESGDQQQGQQEGEQGQEQQDNDQDQQSQAQDQQDKDQQAKVQDGEQGERQDEAGSKDERQSDDPAEDEKQGRQEENGGQAKEAEDRAAEQPGEDDLEEQSLPETSRLPEDKLTGEQRQALEQWLRQIPDNPGGLLKRKFKYQYRQNRERNPQETKKIW